MTFLVRIHPPAAVGQSTYQTRPRCKESLPCLGLQSAAHLMSCSPGAIEEQAQCLLASNSTWQAIAATMLPRLRACMHSREILEPMTTASELNQTLKTQANTRVSCGRLHDRGGPS